MGKFLAKHLGCGTDADLAAQFALEAVPWVRPDHRLVKVNGLSYSLEPASGAAGAP